MPANTLYIPWFQEKHWKRYPGTRLEEHCKTVQCSFQRLILPGDTESWDVGLFSMSDAEERIYETISKVWERIKVITYSLMAFPTLSAIWNLREEIKSWIESVTFLHPAKDPLYAVRVMDYLRREWKGGIYQWEHYINGDTNTVFHDLIEKWNGNAEVFQGDLKYYNECLSRNRNWFEMLKEEIWDRDRIPFRVVDSLDDKVTSFSEISASSRGLLEAQKSHIPVLSWEEIYDLAA